MIDQFKELLEYSDDLWPLAKAFQSFHFEKMASVLEQQTRFVHYTPAEAALAILSNKKVWLRNAKCMNDYSEIEYGLHRLNKAYGSQAGMRFRNFLETKFPGFSKRFEDLFNGWEPHFRNGTYILCVSEHDPEEDLIGRLSMWRGYGETTGVALVMNSTPFIEPSDALQAYSSPVAYLDDAEFQVRFEKIVEQVLALDQEVSEVGEDEMINLVFHFFRYAALCTKHKGFREEKEWRVIYQPSYESGDVIESEVVSIGGIPQRIQKLPLERIDHSPPLDISINTLIDRVIIGPSPQPYPLYEAFVVTLEACDVVDAGNRVFLSDIPIR